MSGPDTKLSVLKTADQTLLPNALNVPNILITAKIICLSIITELLSTKLMTYSL